MSFVQGFRFGLEARLNPFDVHEDLAGRKHLFLYVTGRGELSYLFPDAPESDIIGEAERCIPMGYTQIWILEWVVSVRPEPGKKNEVPSAARRAGTGAGRNPRGAFVRAHRRAFALLRPHGKAARRQGSGGGARRGEFGAHRNRLAEGEHDLALASACFGALGSE